MDVGFETKIHIGRWGLIRYSYGNRDYSSYTTEFGVNDNNDANKLNYSWRYGNQALTLPAFLKKSVSAWVTDKFFDGRIFAFR